MEHVFAKHTTSGMLPPRHAGSTVAQSLVLYQADQASTLDDVTVCQTMFGPLHHYQELVR